MASGAENIATSYALKMTQGVKGVRPAVKGVRQHNIYQGKDFGNQKNFYLKRLRGLMESFSMRRNFAKALEVDACLKGLEYNIPDSLFPRFRERYNSVMGFMDERARQTYTEKWIEFMLEPWKKGPWFNELLQGYKATGMKTRTRAGNRNKV